jgi:hypothetical protein
LPSDIAELVETDADFAALSDNRDLDVIDAWKLPRLVPLDSPLVALNHILLGESTFIFIQGGDFFSSSSFFFFFFFFFLSFIFLIFLHVFLFGGLYATFTGTLVLVNST